MPRMKMPSGEVYDVPDSDVRIAQSQYGAVPVTADTLEGKGVGPGQVAAGAVGSALQSIGGLGGIAKLGGAGAVLYGGKKWLDSRGRPKPPPATPPPAAAPAPAPAPAHPSEDRIREAKAAKAEADARAATARADAAEARAKPPTRTTQPKQPKPKPRTKRPPAKVPDRTTAPGSGPAATPEQYAATKARKQQGASKRTLNARQAALSPKAKAAVGLGPADDFMAQLEGSIANEGAMTDLGAPRGPGSGRKFMRRAMGGGHPALQLLMMLMDAQSMPEQMSQSDAMFDEIDPERARLRERLRPQIY